MDLNALNQDVLKIENTKVQLFLVFSVTGLAQHPHPYIIGYQQDRNSVFKLILTRKIHVIIFSQIQGI